MSFEKPEDKERISIGSKDDTSLTVTAQFNPAQLEIAQTVPWKKPDATTQKGEQKGKAGQAGTKKADNAMALEFTGAEGRSLTLELLFDGYEKRPSNKTVAEDVATLEKLATVWKPDSAKDEERRPHHCLVTWKPIGKFYCVIESLTTKYTLFAKDGTPLRATCTVKLKEASSATKAKDPKK